MEGCQYSQKTAIHWLVGLILGVDPFCSWKYVWYTHKLTLKSSDQLFPIHLHPNTYCTQYANTTILSYCTSFLDILSTLQVTCNIVVTLKCYTKMLPLSKQLQYWRMILVALKVLYSFLQKEKQKKKQRTLKMPTIINWYKYPIYEWCSGDSYL